MTKLRSTENEAQTEKSFLRTNEQKRCSGNGKPHCGTCAVDSITRHTLAVNVSAVNLLTYMDRYGVRRPSGPNGSISKSAPTVLLHSNSSN